MSDEEGPSFVKKYSGLLENEQSVDYFITMFEDHLKIYREKATEYEELSSKLKVTPENLSATAKDTLEKLAKLEEATAVENFNLINLDMAFLDTVATRYKYESKSKRLKNDIKEILDMKNKARADTEKIEREIKSAKDQIQNVQPNPPNELDKMTLQIKSYENKLMQYINKYPWLDEPQYNLLSIHDEIKKLNELQNQVERAESELQCYEGLKPDLVLARNQLREMKTEYEEITKKISDMDHLKL